MVARVLVRVALCGALCAGLAACQFRVERDPQVLVRYLPADPQSLNPITGTDAYQVIVNEFVTESLIERHPATREWRGVLATAWTESADHLAYTFTLRKGVRWHDGAPFTAFDVAYSFDRINDPAVGAGHLLSYYQKAGIVQAEALDAHTVRFRLERPYFLALEVVGTMPIVPQHLFDDGTDFRKHPANRRPVGTGPMRFRSWQTSRSIKLTRNDDYWGTPPAFAGITFRIIPDQGVAFQAMKKRQIDLSGLRSIQWARQTASEKFLRYFKKMRYLPESAGYAYIGWNLDHPILREQAVRQALTMLVPREKILHALLFNEGQIVTGPFYPFSPQYHARLPGWPYDPKRAARLLDQAGWHERNAAGVRVRNGTPLALTVVYPGPARLYDALGNILREDLRRAGIALEVRRMEWTVFLKTTQDRQFDLYFGGWTGGYEQDPHQIWHSSQVGNGSNYVGYRNAEVDRIIETARTTFDPDTRNALYHRMHRIIHDEQPYTFLFTSPALSVRHHRFGNVQIYQNGYDLREWAIGPSEALLQ